VGTLTNAALGNFAISVAPSFVQSILGTTNYAGFVVKLTRGQRFFFDSTRNSLSSLKPNLHLVYDHPPKAVADAYSMSQGGSLAISAPGVLANDTDAEGDILSAVLVSGPAHGVLALNGDGSFTYTPSAGFSGS